jgi:transcriptional regulator with XRE-family HTH domain
MIHAAHLRAARALLGWRQDDLARQAKVGLATLQRIESADGPVSGNARTIWKLQATLEHAGIRFIGGGPGEPTIGVSKQAPPPE